MNDVSHPIPKVFDPMGKHWPQPARESILVDETHALMPRSCSGELLDYSHSIPTGVYPGKMWKRAVDSSDPTKGYLLCWFSYCHKGPDYCELNSRIILTID